MLLLPLMVMALAPTGSDVSNARPDIPAAMAAHRAPLSERTLLSPRPAAATPENWVTGSASMVMPVDRERTDVLGPPAHQSEPDGLEIASAERLSIRFQGLSDLTGDYRVRADGSITVPVVGRIVLTGMNNADLEAVLTQRVSAATGRDAYVGVEVLEYRPIFVTGFVSKPGAFPWRPGMTVLQAQALAGGTYRSLSEGGAVRTEDTELLRLQKAIADQKRNLAAFARLQAEQKGQTTIEVPNKLIALVGRPEAEALIKMQSSAIVSRRASLEAKRAALAHATVMANKELKGLNEQAERMKVQLKTVRNYKEAIDGLQSKGLVRSDRSITEAARVSDLEDRDSVINVAIARVQVMLASLERDRINIEHERMAEIDGDIIKAEREIAQLDIDIEGARTSYRKITGQEPPMSVASSETPKKAAIRYEIVRPSADADMPVKPDQYALVRPGDTLIVSID